MKRIRNIVLLVLASAAIGCEQPTEVSTVKNLSARDTDTPHNPFGSEGSFLILRGPTERLPRLLRFHLARLLSSAHLLHAQPELVQRARTPFGPAWVFVEGDELCLAQGHGGAVACSQVKRAALEGVTLGTFIPPSRKVPKPHHFLLMGLMPDAVKRVAITSGRRRAVLSVQGNLVSASAGWPILIRRLIRLKG